jgi:hypothetical protein
MNSYIVFRKRLVSTRLIIIIIINEELRDLYPSPSIIRIIKSRRMRWTGLVARMGRRRTHIDYWREIQRERDH